MESITTTSEGPRRPLSPLGNGKMRVFQIVLGGLMSLLASMAMAKYTASEESDRTRRETQAQIATELAVMNERQRNQYQEVIRLIEQLREDLRIEQRGRR